MMIKESPDGKSHFEAIEQHAMGKGNSRCVSMGYCPSPDEIGRQNPQKPCIQCRHLTTGMYTMHKMRTCVNIESLKVNNNPGYSGLAIFWKKLVNTMATPEHTVASLA